MEESGDHPPFSQMGSTQISGKSGAGIQKLEERFPAGIGLFFCAVSLLVLIPLFSAVVLTDYRVADDFRLVGQIDFPTALGYFSKTTGFGRNEYRPLVQVTFAWDNWIWGDRSFGYHLTNVLIHTANGVLLLLVFYRLTGNLVVAFFSATLFSFHPGHHSRIAWIAARDGSLSMLFLLISWLLYLSSRNPRLSPGSDSPDSARSVRVKRAFSGAAFLLALLSYEGAVFFPFALAAMELLLAPQPEGWKERIQRTVRMTAPHFLLLVSYAGWWLFLFGGRLGAYDLDLTAWGLLRDFYRLHYSLFYHIQHWLGLVYLLIAVLIWRQRKACGGLVSFSWLLIWLGYLPFLALDGYASRFGYFSSMGVVLFLGLCASGISELSRERVRFQTILPALLLLTLVGYYGHFGARRLQEWVEAGRIAETIPTQLKALRPSFPANSTLVFDQIPRMHRDAYVFTNSFRVAVRSRYSEPIREIFYYPTTIEPSERDRLMQQDPAFHFRYLPEQERLVEISGAYISTASIQ